MSRMRGSKLRGQIKKRCETIGIVEQARDNVYFRYGLRQSDDTGKENASFGFWSKSTRWVETKAWEKEQRNILKTESQGLHY